MFGRLGPLRRQMGAADHGIRTQRPAVGAAEPEIDSRDVAFPLSTSVTLETGRRAPNYQPVLAFVIADSG